MTVRQVMSIALLGFVCLFAIGREFGALEALAPFAGLALLTWAAIEWRQLALIAKITFSASLALGLFVYSTGGFSSELLATAVARSAFFTFFLMSMDILRTAAMSSPMVLESGKIVVSQPPGRRYAMITIGGHLFSILLNLGSITLLGTMNRRSIEENPDGESARVQEIRLQRMTLALLRGFTAFTMWAPTSVTTIVVLSSVPELDWSSFAPVGFIAVAVYLTFGWLLDRLSHPRRAIAQAEPLTKVLVTLIPMTALTIAILLLALCVSWIVDVRLIAALFMSVPVVGLLWMFRQNLNAGPAGAASATAERLGKQVLPDLVTLRSEVAILAAAGFIAAILPHQIDTEQLGQFVSGLGLTEGMLLAALLWFSALSAPLGLNPIISVAVGIEIVSRLPGFEFNPYLLALGGIWAWGVATGSSPLGATTRISGRTINRSPALIGLVWNRPFTLFFLGAASAIQLLFH